MSSYITFYLKGNSNEYLPIGSFSRSHTIYGLFHDFVPYENIRPLDGTLLMSIAAQATERVESAKRALKDNEKMIEQIATFNNSVEEKLAAMDQLREINDDLRYDQNENEYSYYFVEMLLGMIEEAEYTKYEEGYKLDSNSYIYAGIDEENPNIQKEKS